MKILLLTHNPVCTHNNMGKTFLSLFSEFKREQLCQLYIHVAIPDVDVCSSYFQITDKMIVKAGLLGTPGREISVEMVAEQIKKRKNGEGAPPPKWQGADPVKCLLRDAMWKMSHWYSKELRAWLDREAPTAIFLAPGYAKFIYNMALKIAHERSLPIVTYVCDDYYFVKPPRTYMGKKHLRFLCRKMDELMSKSDRLVVISKEIEQLYSSHFGVKSVVIMTGAEQGCEMCQKTERELLNLSYFGNLSLGRNLSLAEIGRAVDHLNTIHHSNMVLRIYTGNCDAETLSVFEGIDCVSLCGFVSGKLFADAFYSSDMLIHTESFEESNIDAVKHSVSTKIADSLACGIPLFAYGPECISSMKHLLRNDCAIVATSKEQLRPMLEKALTDRNERMRVTQNAVKTAALYHDRKGNSEKLKSIFSEIETNEGRVSNE